jgi:hypothetical protein
MHLLVSLKKSLKALILHVKLFKKKQKKMIGLGLRTMRFYTCIICDCLLTLLGSSLCREINKNSLKDHLKLYSGIHLNEKA